MSLIATPFSHGPANAQDAEPSETAKPAATPADNGETGAPTSDDARSSVPIAPDALKAPASAKPSQASQENGAIRQEQAAPNPAPEAQPATTTADAAAKQSAKPRIVVRSWAGAYGEAQSKAIIAPVARDLDMEI